MNRIEFMTELASLLQDIPVEERKDAMQYYNDYFDDAGEDHGEEQGGERETRLGHDIAEQPETGHDGEVEVGVVQGVAPTTHRVVTRGMRMRRG